MNKRPSNVSYKKNLTIKISLQQIPTTVLETGINQSCFSSFRFLLLLLTYENCYELKFENEEFFEIKVKITAKCWLSSSDFSVHNSASLQLSIWKCDSKIKVKWKINSKRVFLSVVFNGGKKQQTEGPVGWVCLAQDCGSAPPGKHNKDCGINSSRATHVFTLFKVNI